MGGIGRIFRIRFRMIALLVLAISGMGGCGTPGRCEFIGADCVQVGQAIAKSDNTETAQNLFGPIKQEVWGEQFKQALSQGQGGTTHWHVEHFMSSTDGKDKVAFRPVADGCAVEIVSENKENGFLLPGILFGRYTARERSILQRAYWELKKDNPAATARMEGSWQPSDPFMIELHEGSLWAAAKGIPLDEVVKDLQARGFHVDSRSADGNRVELSGHFTSDPFGILFRSGLFTTVKEVKLDEEALIKRQGDIVIVGLWAKGSVQTTDELHLFSSSPITTTNKVSSEDNADALCNVLWAFSLIHTIQPLPPKEYVENIRPAAGNKRSAP